MSSHWPRSIAGLFVVFALFQWTATFFESDRGQAGFIVAAIVLAATLVVERTLFGQPVKRATGSLGLGPPRAIGLATAVGVSVIVVLTVPLFLGVTGTSAAIFPGALMLLPGLFAQAGVAEEVLFRGYLFRRLRQGRSFWQAASLSVLPFVAVHLLLFLTMPWPIALAAVLLALVVSFPMAHLFELGRNTIWGPAILHFVIQSTVKVVVVPDAVSASFALSWIGASALVPQLAFLVARPPQSPGDETTDRLGS